MTDEFETDAAAAADVTDSTGQADETPISDDELEDDFEPDLGGEG